MKAPKVRVQEQAEILAYLNELHRHLYQEKHYQRIEWYLVDG